MAFSISFLSSDVGYFGGGSPGPGEVSIVDKTTFTSDTTARVPKRKPNFEASR